MRHENGQSWVIAKMAMSVEERKSENVLGGEKEREGLGARERDGEGRRRPMVALTELGRRWP